LKKNIFTQMNLEKKPPNQVPSPAFIILKSSVIAMFVVLVTLGAILIILNLLK
jgi:hypothetical protein